MLADSAQILQMLYERVVQFDRFALFSKQIENREKYSWNEMKEAGSSSSFIVVNNDTFLIKMYAASRSIEQHIAAIHASHPNTNGSTNPIHFISERLCVCVLFGFLRISLYFWRYFLQSLIFGQK